MPMRDSSCAPEILRAWPQKFCFVSDLSVVSLDSVASVVPVRLDVRQAPHLLAVCLIASIASVLLIVGCGVAVTAGESALQVCFISSCDLLLPGMSV